MAPPASAFPALVLNADFRPLSYFPLSIWSWTDAIKAVFQERVAVVAEYERAVRSPSFSMRLPSVISLKEYVPTNRRPAFTRFNVFLRDEFICQYCGNEFAAYDLTFDHVIPKSLGGKTTWENIVAACGPCNTKKGNRMLRDSGMRLKNRPFRPSAYQLQEIGRRYPPNYLHESWRDFLYWDTELDPN